MVYPKVLTIQDISCVGQCSLTVALPIISACGVETCVLPSAVLSTHTTGFFGYTVRDLTEDFPGIRDHWKKEGITFDAVYTGYLGSSEQIDLVVDIFETCTKDGAMLIVDPAMADGGILYPAFDMDHVEAMKRLCQKADYLIPNLTEACLLTGIPYRETYDRAYLDSILEGLTQLGCKNVILTGISYEKESTGVVVWEKGEYQYYKHPLRSNGSHGTGDVYASAFVGALVRGKSTFQAAKIAADYTLACIDATAKLENHWYGAAFEIVLGKLIEMIDSRA